MKKKRVLAADRTSGTQTIMNILGGEFDVAAVHSYVRAQESLREPWDLILCGIHFDDSRMFDFAELLKKYKEATGTPFLIFRDLDSELDATFFKSLKISTKAIGAADFVDLFALKSQHGIDRADRMFRDVIVKLTQSASI